MMELGLIGYPLGHSLSPKIHTAAFQSCGLKGEYSLFPIRPDDKQGLSELLTRVRSGEITGLNVTIPHKQNVIEFLDELSPAAKAIGAVNTVYLRENKLVGENTDAPGFLSDLNHFVSNYQSKIKNRKSALILGAGGSARAIVYALVNDGWKVIIAARRREQSQQLISSFPAYQVEITNLGQTSLQSLVSILSLVVNTTPLGMTPNTDQSPLPENISLSKETMVYDLVYHPRETKLVRDARTQGLSATTGLGMLIEQAALAFELWTGRNPPRDRMRASVDHL